MVDHFDAIAERSVIGSCLIADEAIYAVRRILQPGFFFLDILKDAMLAIISLAESDKPADIISVDDWIKTNRPSSELRREDLIACQNAVAVWNHAEYYARIVARYHFERRIYDEAVAIGIDREPRHLDVIRDLILDREGLQSPTVFTYNESPASVLDDILSRKRAESITRSGISAIDDTINGFLPGELNTWGAATNVGKSLLLLNLMDLAARTGKRCLFVGTEMSAKETFSRHLSLSSGIDARLIRTGRVNQADAKIAVDNVANTLSKLPIEILDRPEPSLAEVEAAINRHRAEIVFLDYLERMKMPMAEQLRLAVKEFMRQCKNLARRCNVIIHLASQLNRNTYANMANSPPTLADLSESSAVEKESDKVFLIWQPMQKSEGDAPAEWNPDKHLEAILAKDRHGAKGLVAKLILNTKTLKIRSADHDDIGIVTPGSASSISDNDTRASWFDPKEL